MSIKSTHISTFVDHKGFEFWSVTMNVDIITFVCFQENSTGHIWGWGLLEMNEFVWCVVQPCLNAKVFVVVSNGHTAHSAGLKACHHSEWWDVMKCENGGNAAHFQTVPPQRHSWCQRHSFVHTKSDSSCVKTEKNKKRALERNVQTQLTSAHLKWV